MAEEQHDIGSDDNNNGSSSLGGRLAMELRAIPVDNAVSISSSSSTHQSHTFNMEIEAVSLARYTFVDPVRASRGPAPLEPPIDHTHQKQWKQQQQQQRQRQQQRQQQREQQQSRHALARPDSAQTTRHAAAAAAAETSTATRTEATTIATAEAEETEEAASTAVSLMPEPSFSHYFQPYDEDGAIAEFTDERSNRQLSHIARRLLLPDTYADACYELHAFMDTHPIMGDAVQRNVFKCLKICARLSKLHGYNIHLMWQVIAQAHKRVDEFTEERARTIELWFSKLTNRIRMMTVSPAADGSAPPRLPLRPPPELLDARARGKLLPLPEISSMAVKNELPFKRMAESSESSYYLANPIGRPALQPATIEEEEGEENADGQAVVLSGPSTETVAEEGSLERRHTLIREAQRMQSSREIELLAIEHQLRELESIPAGQMGPMLRAALNLLVEMRFRLQLGLPRPTNTTGGGRVEESAQAAAETSSSNGSSSTALTTSSQRNRFSSSFLPPSLADEAVSAEAFGEDANDEGRVIDYVLNQISTSRRQHQMLQHAAVMNSSATRGIYANNWHNLGAPLYMRRHHAGTFYANPINSNGNGNGSDGSSAGARRPLPLAIDAPRSELRRRRSVDDDGESEEDQSADYSSSVAGSMRRSPSAGFGGAPREPTGGITTDSDSGDEHSIVDQLQQQQHQNQQIEQQQESHGPQHERRERRRQAHRRRRIYRI
ncbi:hypothetical protein IWW48_003457 [Coemansia sp. RSA 1200]|nr:hypothetical protein IWW48_003457 [Coemansia sp. RSA 1200]